MDNFLSESVFAPAKKKAPKRKILKSNTAPQPPQPKLNNLPSCGGLEPIQNYIEESEDEDEKDSSKMLKQSHDEGQDFEMGSISKFKDFDSYPIEPLFNLSPPKETRYNSPFQIQVHNDIQKEKEKEQENGNEQEKDFQIKKENDDTHTVNEIMHRANKDVIMDRADSWNSIQSVESQKSTITQPNPFVEETGKNSFVPLKLKLNPYDDSNHTKLGNKKLQENEAVQINKEYNIVSPKLSNQLFDGFNQMLNENSPSPVVNSNNDADVLKNNIDATKNVDTSKKDIFNLKTIWENENSDYTASFAIMAENMIQPPISNKLEYDFISVVANMAQYFFSKLLPKQAQTGENKDFVKNWKTIISSSTFTLLRDKIQNVDQNVLHYRVYILLFINIMPIVKLYRLRASTNVESVLSTQPSATFERIMDNVEYEEETPQNGNSIRFRQVEGHQSVKLRNNNLGGARPNLFGAVVPPNFSAFRNKQNNF